jgi:hypothetical protein
VKDHLVTFVWARGEDELKPLQLGAEEVVNQASDLVGTHPEPFVLHVAGSHGHELSHTKSTLHKLKTPA